MKMTLKPEQAKPKGVIEIKKYIEKWYQQIRPDAKGETEK